MIFSLSVKIVAKLKVVYSIFVIYWTLRPIFPLRSILRQVYGQFTHEHIPRRAADDESKRSRTWQWTPIDAPAATINPELVDRARRLSCERHVRGERMI